MNKVSVKLSILVPVYNVEDYLVECIESILTQMNEQAELILMNDASTDGSGEILARYQHHERVQVVHAEQNRGISATRNAMKKLALGEYLWFIDSDDVLCAHAYAKVMAQLELHPVDVLIGDFMIWDPSKSLNKREHAFIGKPNTVFANTGHGFLKKIVKSNKNYAWNKIYRHECIGNLNFPEDRIFEDIFFMTDLSALCASYVYVDVPLIAYRVRPGSTVKGMDERYIDDYLSSFAHRIDVWQQQTLTAPDHQFDAYLRHKAFNRYVGLIKELAENKRKLNNHQALMAYVAQHFGARFTQYYQQALPQVNFFRRGLLRRKYHHIQRLLARLPGQT